MAGVYKDPGLGNREADKLNQNTRDKASEEFNKQKTQAEADTENVRQGVEDFDNSRLHKNEGKNIARGEGVYGMMNDRNYNTTLRLAREADAYNNRPVEDIERIGGTSVQNLGQGYTRPKVESAETKAIDQAFSLDINQKQLAQALQDAVNRKDLDAFIEAYKQKFGIVLSRFQAEQEMTKYLRQNEMQQVLTESYAKWDKEFGRYFTDQTSQVIFGLVKSNPQYATMLAASLGYATPPSQYDRVMQEFVDNTYLELVKQGKSERDALADVYQEMNVFNLRQVNVSQYATIKAQSITENMRARKASKAIYKGDGI